MAIVIKIFVLSILLSCIKITANAQTNATRTDAEPRSGVQRLVMEYIKIDFTKPQRELLNYAEIEMIFMIDTIGNATLEDVNGVRDAAIIDSLKQKTEVVGKFRPAQVNGRPVESIFAMIIQYPTYPTPSIPEFRASRDYRRLSIDDLASYELGGRMDVSIGGLINDFAGNANSYLNFGGGFDVSMSFTGKHGYGFGITIGFFGNDRKKEYPIDPTRVQIEAPLTLVIGPTISKSIKRKGKRELLAQLELTYVAQTISARINNQTNTDIQLKGFSPGVTFHYIHKLGKDRFSDSYMPALYSHCVDIHGGIRPLLYNLKAGSGVMFELGISYRILCNFFDVYTLKDRP